VYQIIEDGPEKTRLSGTEEIAFQQVQHALQHPGGDVPARMRGNGRLRRSYLPVWQVCYAIAGLIQADDLAPGQVETLNVACYCDLTNGEVAAEVANDAKLTAERTYASRSNFHWKKFLQVLKRN